MGLCLGFFVCLCSVCVYLLSSIIICLELVFSSFCLLIIIIIIYIYHNFFSSLYHVSYNNNNNNNNNNKTIPNLLAPYQLGFGIAGGIEAAIHASRVYLNALPSDKALVKVDFRNAFNSIRRDKILGAVEDHIPELLPYVQSAYASSSVLMWNDA